MFQYFNDFYINMKYGPSYILTEVLVVVVGVVLLTDISFFKNLRTNLKDLAFFALKLIGSFVCVLFIESLLYALPVQNAHSLDIVYPVFIAAFALFFSNLRWMTRLSVAPLYYALVLLNMGLSESAGYILRITVMWDGFTAVFQCVYMIVITLFLKFFSTERFDYVSVWYAVFIIAVAAITIVLYNVIPPQSPDRELSVVVYLGYFFMSLLAYLIFWLTAREHSKRIAAEIIQEKQENAAEFIRATQDTYEKLCILRHDIKNQYAAMSALIDEGNYDQLQQYFKQYFKQYENELNSSNCGNNVIDNLINIEKSKAREYGAEIECEMAVPPVLPFADADLCSVLTNLLDNAIEATETLPDEGGHDRGKIKLYINNRQEYLFIRVVNECSGLDDGEYTGFDTTKEDKTLHGYGTKIVRRIVHKYQGSVRYSVTEGKFVAYVMLSMRVGKNGSAIAEGGAEDE